MTVSLETPAPLSYNEWFAHQNSLVPSSLQEAYNAYLTSWYNQTQASQKPLSLKQDYIQLLKDLSFLFGQSEKDRFLNDINFASDEELIYAIPFFAKKLKDIAKTLSYKRESIKNSKLKYNLVGANEGAEKILYDYVLKGFTRKDDTSVQIPAAVLQTLLPDLSAVKDNFYVEIEELHDPSNYHDSDPSVGANHYITLSDVEKDIPFTGDLSEQEILGILSSRFLSRVADTPLSKVFGQYLTSIPSLSTVSLSATANQSIYNQIGAGQKYLGETFYALTAIRTSEYNVPDQKLLIDLEAGNNWFLWPSGDRVFDSLLFNNIFAPITINSSNFVTVAGGSVGVSVVEWVVGSVYS